MLFTFDIGTMDFRFSSLLENKQRKAAFTTRSTIFTLKPAIPLIKRFIHHIIAVFISALRSFENSFVLEESLLVLLALVVAVDDLQEEAGESDELGVRRGKEALEEAVTGLVEQDEDGQRILHLAPDDMSQSEDFLSGTHTQYSEISLFILL